MPTVSIIVPVYNTQRYLRRCIESITAQTLSDFELLLINDGSTDGCGKICDEYAGKDTRIRVFHKENGGVSSARNMGLNHAKGEWITFIDSDDCVSPHYLRNLYQGISEKIDLVFSYATRASENGHFEREHYPQKLISSDEIEVAFVENELSWHTSPWSKLYRADLIRGKNLQFDESMHIGEDLVFLYTYILYCNQILFTGDTDYFYYYNNNDSLTKRVNSLQSELHGLSQINNMLDRLCEAKHISNPVALQKILWIRGSYTGRVLNALYHEAGISRTERMRTIKKLDLTPFLTAVRQRTFKGKFLSSLLRHGMVGTYDFFREAKSYLN